MIPSGPIAAVAVCDCIKNETGEWTGPTCDEFKFGLYFLLVNKTIYINLTPYFFVRRASYHLQPRNVKNIDLLIRFSQLLNKNISKVTLKIRILIDIFGDVKNINCLINSGNLVTFKLINIKLIIIIIIN